MSIRMHPASLPWPSSIVCVCSVMFPTAQHCRAALTIPWTYHCFLPEAAMTLQPLHLLCWAHPSCTLQWTPTAMIAFSNAKKLLTSAATLTHPHPTAALRISSDASNQGVGVVLEQHSHHGWHPLSFYSRHLTPAETRYSAFDKELLAAYSAIHRFQPMIEGRDCILITDHKPLIHALAR